RELGVLLEAGEQEEGLRLEGVALLVLVEAGQERVLLDDLEEEPRPEPLGEDARQAGLAHADGALDDDQRHIGHRAYRRAAARPLRRGRPVWHVTSRHDVLDSAQVERRASE